MAIIILIALLDYLFAGYSRRTFVFYTALEGKTIVEDRMIRRSGSQETDIRRYVEEVLLGPVSPDAMAFFTRDTRLLSLLFRKGVVYAGFSGEAAFPGEGGDVFLSFLTLNEGIRRNFFSVKDVKIFIGGNEIFFNEFARIIADFKKKKKKIIKRH
ncbi:MAG: hypothetical protein LBH43_20920 [Treponema sp.]|nr:hypothetical protein [Treponema sp.]